MTEKILVLIIGSPIFGYEYYGPFSESEVDGREPEIEERNMTEHDHIHSSCFWGVLHAGKK